MMIMPVRLLLSLVVTLTFGLPALGAVEIYVAPTGDDTNSGTEQKPFATLTRARDAVRQQKTDDSTNDITVYLRGGVYRLAETVVFTRADSAAPGQRITYAAFPGEIPVLCSDVPITDWKKLKSYPDQMPHVARGKVWVANVSSLRKLKQKQAASPTVATQMDRTERFLTLYQGDRRLPRARGKSMSLRKKPAAQVTDQSTFVFPVGALRNWPDLSEAEVSFIPRRSWINVILPIKDVDQSKGIAHTKVPATYRFDWRNSEDSGCWIENVLAVLDQPGEWVLDSRTDTLYLWPLDGAPTGDIVAPALTELIRVAGNIDYAGPTDMPVTNLVFRGLTFTRGDRFPWHGQTGWGVQHDWERFDSPSAMLRFRGTRNCAVIDCHFTTAGCTGLRCDLLSQRNRIAGNHFEHLGGVGILLAGYGPGTKNVNCQNVVENNSLHHLGELYHGSPGLFVWQSGENRLAHNLLHDLPYTGICITGRIVWDPEGKAECSQTIRWHEVGGREIAKRFRDKQNPYRKPGTWKQREPFLHARNNIVERNDIHHVMQVCGDGNCIYISGAGDGNLILENYCHDCPSPHMNNSIRCDDDQEGTVIKRNIIYRMGGYAEGLMSKGKNTIVENLVIDLQTGARHRGYLRFYSGDVRDSIIQRNVFYSCESGQNATYDGSSRNGRPGPRLQDTNADYNLYYSTVEPDWGAAHLRKMRPLGVEWHSLSADPLFVDIEKGNFRFQADSPALKLGIGQPLPIEDIGLREPYRSELGKQVASDSESTEPASATGASDSAARPSTPRILIVGDSITFQCREFVAKNLGNKADLFWLGIESGKKINGGDTKRALGNVRGAALEDWLAVGGGNWDIILFNYGLHDLKFAGYRMSNKQVCSPQEYKLNLTYIVERLRMTGARLVWITVTPMPGSSEGTRIPGDEVVYNEAAFEVLADYPNVMISDLYVSSMAHLDQQDSVHFTKVEGKQRAADLHCAKLDILTEQIASASDAQQKRVSNHADGLIVEMAEQIHKEGAWIGSWRHMYSYDTQQRRTSETAEHNHHGQWKKAYLIAWDYDAAGRVTKKLRQQWRRGQWVDSSRDLFSYSDTGKVKLHLQQALIDGQWLGQRKQEYVFNDRGGPTTRESYVKVAGQWIKILRRVSAFADGKKRKETLFARMGKEWAPRYMYDYFYASNGVLTGTAGQRHYNGEWIKSAEFRRDGSSDEQSLKGWAEGKNEWKEIYSINIARNENGLTTKAQYREKLPSIGLGEIPLLTREIQYDRQRNVAVETVTIAVKKNGAWISQPAVRQTYKRGSAT